VDLSVRHRRPSLRQSKNVILSSITACRQGQQHSPRLIVSDCCSFSKPRQSQTSLRAGQFHRKPFCSEYLSSAGGVPKASLSLFPNGSRGGQSRKWVQGRGLVQQNIGGARQYAHYEAVTRACHCPNSGQGVHWATHLLSPGHQKCKSASTLARSCSKEMEAADDALCW